MAGARHLSHFPGADFQPLVFPLLVSSRLLSFLSLFFWVLELDCLSLPVSDLAPLNAPRRRDKPPCCFSTSGGGHVCPFLSQRLQGLLSHFPGPPAPSLGGIVEASERDRCNWSLYSYEWTDLLLLLLLLTLDSGGQRGWAEVVRILPCHQVCAEREKKLKVRNTLGA